MYIDQISVYAALVGFSALQRAEIAEIDLRRPTARARIGFSALQRAEIAEIVAATVNRAARP